MSHDALSAVRWSFIALAITTALSFASRLA